MDVTVTHRRGEAGAQQVAGEDPLDLHAVAGEHGAHRVGVGGAVAQADRERNRVGVGHYEPELDRGLDVDVRLHRTPCVCDHSLRATARIGPLP